MKPKGPVGAARGALEVAVKDPTLNLILCLQRGHNLKQIKESAHIDLVQAARGVLAAKQFLSISRKDELVLELGLIADCEKSLRCKKVFGNTLSLAVEFNLSDGSLEKRRRYFQEAEHTRIVKPKNEEDELA